MHSHALMRKLSEILNPASSCSSVNKHSFNLNNGSYWIQKNGAPFYEYHNIDEPGIPSRNPDKDFTLSYRTVKQSAISLEAFINNFIG